MSFDLTTTEVSAREIRLKSLNAFTGNIESIISKTRDGSLKNCERFFSQNKTCLSMMVMDQLR